MLRIDINPFLKWAGGKGQLLGELKARLPKSYGNYFEPFIGGGALFFSIHPQNAAISDINPQLINAYRQLKKSSRSVIREIRKITSCECDDKYYREIRSRYNQKIESGELDSECAALMIWLNKHCFNGLYRVNSKGLFNVPYNNNRCKSIDEENLAGIGRYLSSNDIQIKVKDFEKACNKAKEGDFIYFDSPYLPESDTADFTDYTKEGFTMSDHERLARLFRKLNLKGIKLMLSNNDVPKAHELYSGFLIERIGARRSINSNASKRTGKEVIIRNYSD